MAIVTSVLPVAFGLFSLQFPAGLVLYFLVSNLWRLGQQEIIMHKITRPGQAAIAAAAGGAIDVKSEEADTDTRAFPKAAGGLRKLFQLPAAANGAPTGDANGDASGTTGSNGTTKPKAGQPSGGAKSGGAKPGGSGKGSTGGARAGGSGSAGSGSSARRRNSKKRKRR